MISSEEQFCANLAQELGLIEKFIMIDTTIAILQKATSEYDNLNWLECDGLTRVLHAILTYADIEHLVCFGSVFYNNQRSGERKNTVKPHFWLEVKDGSDGWIIVDYRLRMWLGDYPYVPYGVFRPTEFEAVEYEGESIYEPVLNKANFDVLTSPELNNPMVFKDLLKGVN